MMWWAIQRQQRGVAAIDTARLPLEIHAALISFLYVLCSINQSEGAAVPVPLTSAPASVQAQACEALWLETCLTGAWYTTLRHLVTRRDVLVASQRRDWRKWHLRLLGSQLVDGTPPRPAQSIAPRPTCLALTLRVCSISANTHCE